MSTPPRHPGSFRRPPGWWPRPAGPARSTAVTARVGRVLGVCVAVCFVTGLLSHYQYHPWSWLPEPARPVWGYRLSQGLHVLTGTATLPLLLVKLWSVYPRLFQWPPARSVAHLLERLSVGVLVATALVELVTGFLNAIGWYPWPWSFVPVHHDLAYVLVGSLLLHVAVQLPVIRSALSRPVDAPEPAEGLSRRGVLTAAGAGIGLVVVTSAGQSVTSLRRVGLLAIRDADQGPQGVPVNRTAAQAGVTRVGPSWALDVRGPRPYRLPLAELESLARTSARLPVACVEGWSVDARWRGVALLDVVRRAGGGPSSRVRLVSMEPAGAYRTSVVEGPQLARALLATHLGGRRLDLDHGYPVRLIAPDRAGVLNTKWLHAVEVVS